MPCPAASPLLAAGHNLGANHAGIVDAITGAFTEYYDLTDPMSTGERSEPLTLGAASAGDRWWRPDTKKRTEALLAATPLQTLQSLALHPASTGSCRW
jgi:hypothetical protein